MSKLWKRIKRRGFTLVELLVVIAIIGILVSIVMPAITDALTRGKLTQMAANGRNLVQSLMAKETQDIYLSQSIVWPRSYTDTSNEEGVFDSSTEFFSWLVTNEVMSVNYSFFSGPGVPSATQAGEFSGDQGDYEEGYFNAWCVAGDVTTSTEETCPVILTRNLGEDVFDQGQGGMPYERLNDDIGDDERNEPPDAFIGTPFEKKGFVFVTKGGAAFAPFKEDMKTGNFTNIYQYTVYSNAVLRPNSQDSGEGAP